MSTTVNCQDCQEQWEVAEEEIPLAIQDDSLVVSKGYYGSLRYFGICTLCKIGYKKREVVPEDEFVKLYRLRDKIHVLHPELPMAEVCGRAVQILNDPLGEPNLDYRAYLMEWIPRQEVAA